MTWTDDLEVKLNTLSILTRFQTLQGSKTDQVKSAINPGALCQSHLFPSILLQKTLCHSNINHQHYCQLISSHMGNSWAVWSVWHPKWPKTPLFHTEITIIGSCSRNIGISWKGFCVMLKERSCRWDKWKWLCQVRGVRQVHIVAVTTLKCKVRTCKVLPHQQHYYKAGARDTISGM